MYRQTLKLQPPSHPGRPDLLSNLALALRTRFGQLNQHEDLEEATLLHREALKLLPASHPSRPSHLTYVAQVVVDQFGLSGRHEDLEEAISLHREALELLPASHSDRSIFLHNLSESLSSQFSLSGCRQNLEEAILLLRRALEVVSTSHAQRPKYMSHLGNDLRMRFMQSGRREDLEEAILLQRQALGLISPSHLYRPNSLRNLSLTLCTRFEQLGRREDLEESIILNRQAIELLTASYVDGFIFFDSLACDLQAQFELLGRQEDLEEAISLHRKALELIPISHAFLSKYFNNLANALCTRFAQSRRPEDLGEAISLHRKALDLRPGSHPSRAVSLTNLASTLSTVRHAKANPTDDLNEAILLYREALELIAASHPDRPLSLSNLGLVLSMRYELSAQREDLEEAIGVASQSLDALVNNHPLTCLVARNQGDIFFVAYSHTKESQYLHKAMNSLRVAVACEASPISFRFRVAKWWAGLADFRHDSALDAYLAAIQLLPRLATLGLDLPSRQQALTSGSDGLARAAAACAIRSGQFSKAVELLEEGRGVFWSQALQLRTPMNDLRDVAPELEEKLKRISLALEQGSLRDVSRSPSYDSRRIISMDQEASHFRRLNDEWLETLENVRQLEGFQDFLRPRRVSTLLGAAGDAPLVVFNASDTGCAALILTSTEVQHVPLPRLTFVNLNRLVGLIQTATTPGSRDIPLPESSREHMENLVRQMSLPSDTLQLLGQHSADRHMTRRVLGTTWKADDVFRVVLSTLWQFAVEPVIRLLGFEVSCLCLEQFLPLELAPLCRNPICHQTCGGALQDRSRFFQYMPREYMTLRSRTAFLTMLSRRTRRR